MLCTDRGFPVMGSPVFPYSLKPGRILRLTIDGTLTDYVIQGTVHQFVCLLPLASTLSCLFLFLPLHTHTSRFYWMI